MKKDEFRPDEDPLRPILWAIVMAIVVVAVVLALSACATPPAKDRGGFPPDMTLVCHRGMAFIVSNESQQVLALPFHCQSA